MFFLALRIMLATYVGLVCSSASVFHVRWLCNQLKRPHFILGSSFGSAAIFWCNLWAMDSLVWSSTLLAADTSVLRTCWTVYTFCCYRLVLRFSPDLFVCGFFSIGFSVFLATDTYGLRTCRTACTFCCCRLVLWFSRNLFIRGFFVFGFFPIIWSSSMLAGHARIFTLLAFVFFFGSWSSTFLATDTHGLRTYRAGHPFCCCR